ncbi:MAG: chromate transporter, partial [bacterium]
MTKALLQLAALFSTLSLSAFGGGKVILPTMHQAAVGEYDWMTSQQFVDLFSISMAAPGPSMMMVSLVGLKACLPYGTVIALLGALVATIGMFLPSSILVFVAGGFWDRWEESPWRKTIKKAIMPISTGLILAATWIIAKDSIHSVATGIMAMVALGLMLFTKLNP